ncbi:rhodanese-like domain-containing protein [Proteobacteria bacterium 005FR1]|nr:rhodanese-like domain-containing protein [Proteobacteria bacterium 005FR1]
MKSQIASSVTQTLAALVLGFAALLASVSASAKEAVWIDVRSGSEYQSDHIAGVPLIPHSEIRAGVGALNIDKDTPIKLFCRSGGRAGVAKTALEEMGYTNVENLGGIADARKVREKSE